MNRLLWIFTLLLGVAGCSTDPDAPSRFASDSADAQCKSADAKCLAEAEEDEDVLQIVTPVAGVNP
jgi:hypothetical protein